jgi:hypothetical protein
MSFAKRKRPDKTILKANQLRLLRTAVNPAAEVKLAGLSAAN